MEESEKTSNENASKGLSSSAFQRSGSGLQNSESERGSLQRSYSSLSNSGYGNYNNYSSSSYSSAYGSPYSSYSSGYSSGYGGYGGYGASYGNYGNSYGTSYNQYSNQYSKPMRPEEMQNQAPPQNLRQDVWGFLNGFHAILNILYAGTGIVHFGRAFMRMTVKILKAASGKTFALLFRLTGIKFLQKLVQRLAVKGNWMEEFDTKSDALDLAWNNKYYAGKKGGIFKILTILRILALAGTLVSFILKKKAGNEPQIFQTTQVSEEEKEMMINEHKNEEENQEAGISKVIEFEDAQNLYDQIKNIKKMNLFERTYTSLETVQEVVEETKVDSPLLKKTNSSKENSLLHLSSPIQKQETPSSIEKTNEITQESMTTAEFKITDEKTNKEEVQETKLEKNGTEPEKLRSEEFWKAGEQILTKSFSIDETKLKSEKKKDEEPFELPSMLKSSSTVGKKPAPWLVRKKEKSQTVALKEQNTVNNLPDSLSNETLNDTNEIQNTDTQKSV